MTKSHAEHVALRVAFSAAGSWRRLLMDSPELRVAFCIYKVWKGHMVPWKRYFSMGEHAKLTFQHLKVLFLWY